MAIDTSVVLTWRPGAVVSFKESRAAYSLYGRWDVSTTYRRDIYRLLRAICGNGDGWTLRLSYKRARQLFVTQEIVDYCKSQMETGLADVIGVPYHADPLFAEFQKRGLRLYGVAVEVDDRLKYPVLVLDGDLRHRLIGFFTDEAA